MGTAQDDSLPALALNDAYFPTGGKLQKRDLPGAATAWTFTADEALTGLPLYLNGYLYTASTKGNVYGVDAASGQQVWTDDLSAFLPNPNYYFFSNPFTGFAAAEGLPGGADWQYSHWVLVHRGAGSFDRSAGRQRHQRARRDGSTA